MLNTKINHKKNCEIPIATSGKTKSFTTILIFSFSFFICSGQAPNWQWANGAGGTSIDEALSVAVDGAGNSYVAGDYWSSTIVFGSDTLTNASGLANVFLAKYDAGGNVLWAKGAGGGAHDAANSVAVDGAGNIYIAGYFASPSIIFGSDTLFNSGNRDAFLVKYDANGNVLWATKATGTHEDAASSVAADGTGNVYITGYFMSSSITFGSTTLTNPSSPASDLFLAKYDANGNALWAKRAGGIASEAAFSIAVDGTGNSYITGHFDGPSLAFGSDTLTIPNYMFLAKYDANGNVLWAKGSGASGNDYAQSVAVDGTGNSYIAGYYQGPYIIFGSDTLTNANSNSKDIFLAKYDVNGNVLWAKRAGSADYDYAYSVAVDGTGNSYITGPFFNSPITFGSTVLTNAGSADLFVAKYDAGGNVVWAKGAGGTSYDGTRAVAVTGSGDCYIAGNFGLSGNPTLTFGSTVLTNAGSTDIFHAKLNSTTGVEEENNSEAINIFPNPTLSETIIRSTKNLKDATLTICNAVGQEVKSIKNISGYEIKLQRDNLPNGFYLIHLVQDHETLAIKKLMIID